MLYQHFVNYDYRLHNSFVYNWESDFFAMSSSGYFVEVEVKVSRGDYFRDFGKDKHDLFKAISAKRSHYISHREGAGDEICRYNYGKLFGYETAVSDHHWRGERRNGKYGYWVNDTDWVYMRKEQQIVHARATHIQFHKTAEKKCPNQLYFACPTDLIKLEEIPPYAGLMYCGEEIKVIRRAPYLHKEKQDMTRALLNKFYNLWQYKTKLDQKIEVTGQYNLFTR